MKKILTTALVLGALYGTANATELKPYIGLQGSRSNTEFKNYFLNADNSINKNESKNFTGGAVAGLKLGLNENFYVGAEAYINLGYLIDESKTYSYPGERWTEEISLSNPYGLRFDAGYKVNNFSAFAFAGLNANYYTSKYNYDEYGVSYFHSNEWSQTVFAPSIGLGISYNITKNIEAKLSYEYSKFTVEDELLKKYQDFFNDDINGDVDMKVSTIRLGVNYLF